MSKQPIPTDIIELEVADDGDTTLTKRPVKPTYNLGYMIEDLKNLQIELESYGCWDTKTIKKAILEVTFSDYNQEILIK